MRDALNASGRAIFFSNEYPAAHENYPPYGEKGQYNFTWMVQNHGKAMGSHANMWRISQDIGASCECLPAVCAVVPALHCLATIEVTAVCTGHSILNNIDFDTMWAEFAAPGSINDPDMLQVTCPDRMVCRDVLRTRLNCWSDVMSVDRRWATEG